MSVKHTFDRSAIRAVFTTHTTYLKGLIYMGVNLSMSSVSGFLPTIIGTMGWSPSQSQLMTVPLYAVAFVVTISACFLSDRLRTRGPFVVLLMLLSAAGFAVLLREHQDNGVRYFATFLVVMGAFATGPLMMSWAGNTAGSQSASALRTGFMNAMGQCLASRSRCCMRQLIYCSGHICLSCTRRAALDERVCDQSRVQRPRGGDGCLPLALLPL